MAGCLGPEKGAALEALWLPPVPEAFSFCIPYSHLCRILSAGKLSSYREGAQIAGVQTSLLAEDEGPKQDLSQKLCCLGLSQKLLASVVHTLTCTD